MGKDLGILITEEQIEESGRVRKFLRELMPKQIRGYYSSGGCLGYYEDLINPEPFY